MRFTVYEPSISNPVDPLLTDAESASLLSVSVSTFHRRVANGSITKPVKLGRISRWPRSEILSVIERAKAARAEAA